MAEAKANASKQQQQQQQPPAKPLEDDDEFEEFEVEGKTWHCAAGCSQKQD